MLDGTTDAQDAKLIADINAADPFDGGCAADVEEAPDLSKLTADLQAACDKHNSGERVGQPVEVRVQVGALRQAYKSGRCHGLIDAHDWLRANGFKEAAHELTRAAAKIRERIDSEPHRA